MPDQPVMCVDYVLTPASSYGTNTDTSKGEVRHLNQGLIIVVLKLKAYLIALILRVTIF